jgi:serine/threonine-protein kinase
MREENGLNISVGEVIDTYVIETVVATGTTSTTFRARDQRLDRTVTLKVLHGEIFAGVPGARQKAVDDATLAASLEHPNIVPVYGAGEAGDGLWVASRLADGDTLADAALSPRRAVELLERVAEAIDAAHVIGAVHREIRPECIVLDRWGNPLVRDFGVTRMSGRTGMATRMELLDTLRYAAPELILGRPATPAADVYGLAATAVWCLTGTHPFPDRPISELVAMRTQAPPPALAASGVDASALNAAVAAGMALDPVARPQSAAELVALLKRAVARLPAHVAEAPAPFALAAEAAVTGPSTAATPPLGVPASSGPARADRPRPADPPAPADPPPIAAFTPVPGAPAAPPAPPAGATRFDRRREHEPEPEAEQPPTPWVTIILCVTTVLALGVGAIGIGGMSAPGPPEPPRTGRFDLVPGTVWASAPIGQAPLQLEDPVVFALRRSANAASASASASEPEPAPAVASVGLIAKPGPPANPLAGEPLDVFVREPEPTLVRAGRRTLVRYRGALNVGGAVTVLVLPTNSGRALAVACSQPAAEAPCAALLETARLGGVRAVTPQPTEAVARAIADAVRKLERARGIASLRLRAAAKKTKKKDDDDGAAAQAANQLASEYGEAAQALSLDEGDAGTRAQLARISEVALDAQEAVERMSTAIDTEDDLVYDAARVDALNADRTLAQAIKRLRRSGYSVRVR